MQEQVPLLQKSKKNAIVKEIQKVGLDPREFALAEDEAEARIMHKQSPARFTISGDSATYSGVHVVGDWGVRTYQVRGWLNLMVRIGAWLADVKLDLDTPDLWAQIQSETHFLGATEYDEANNTPFTEQEKGQIAQQLNEFGEYAARTYSLSGGQLDELRDRLNYLVRATDRLGRIDWRNAVVGAIFGYLMSAALPSETARDLLSIVARIIGHFHGLPGLLGG